MLIIKWTYIFCDFSVLVRLDWYYSLEGIYDSLANVGSQLSIDIFFPK
jgi:hypothetical protein